MALKIGEIQEGINYIIPNPTGNGNTVHLKTAPYIDESDKIVFEFVETIKGTEYVYTHKQFNPESSDTEKQLQAGLRRLVQLLCAFMVSEKQAEFKGLEVENVKEMIDEAVKRFDADFTKLSVKLLVVYKGGYLTLPFGNIISSKHRELILSFDQSQKQFSLKQTASDKKADDDDIL